MFEGLRVDEFRSSPARVFELDSYRHGPSDAELIGRGETEPLDPWLIERLWAIDVSALSEDEAIGYAVAMDRIANAAHARRGVAVNQAVAAAPDTAEIPRELAAAGQLGAALGLGSGATDSLIAEAGQLADMLPGTQAMALAGDLPWRKAASIAGHTIGMTAEHAAKVENKVLGKAWERSPARHDAAVRRAVDQVDPEHADRKRKDREQDVRLVIEHYGAGMGQAFIDAPSEWLEAIKAGANSYARRMKAGGDARALDVLRVYFLYQAAMSQLSHGDPAHCIQHCDPPLDLPGRPSGPPTQHGRPVAVHVAWDLTSLLGLTGHCGLLRDSGTLLPPSAMRDLLAGGGRMRRMIIDADTGEQRDLTPTTWELPPTDGHAHPAPVVLTLTTTARLGELPDDIRALVDADPVLRQMLDYPLSADDLDNQPDAKTPTPALAEFAASRAAHPVNPTAGPTAASAADLDHHQARSHGGETVRANLGPLVRRWHRIKTFAGWTVKQVKRGWEWTSPTGRTYTIEPHDYRLGP